MAKTITLKDTSTSEVLYPVTLAGNVLGSNGEPINLDGMTDPTSAINSAVSTHNSSSSAHQSAINSAVSSAVSTHNSDGSAHLSTINSAISAHNTNGNAHSTLFSGKADKVAVVNQTASSVTISPNVFNKWSTISSLTITLAAGDSSILNEYFFEFVSGSTATTLSLPTTIAWMGGVAPTIKANKTYQISIVNNLAICAEF